MPALCPVCGTPIVRDPDAVRHYCPNTLCPARVGQEFEHFVGRGAMDIEGAGWKVLSQLLEKGLIKKRGDFFRLTVEDLESLDRFARKSAENLYASIQRAKVRPLFRIISGLGIPQVGGQTAIDMSTWIARPLAAAVTTSRWAEPTVGCNASPTSCARFRRTRFEDIPGVGQSTAASLASLACRSGDIRHP